MIKEGAINKEEGANLSNACLPLYEKLTPWKQTGVDGTMVLEQADEIER